MILTFISHWLIVFFFCLFNQCTTYISVLKPSFRTQTEVCITMTARILPSAIPVDPLKYIDVFCCLVDPKANLYRGMIKDINN